MKEEGSTKYGWAFAMVTALFFMWGFITVLVDSFVPHLKSVFELNNAQANVIQFSFFLAYGVFSIPAGRFLSKFGYQKGIILGLFVIAFGCLLYYTAAGLRLFPVFLCASFTAAGGMAILQVAANPYVSVLGSPKGAASRLNLSQAFNSLGTTLAPLVGATSILGTEVLGQDAINALDNASREAYFVREAAGVKGPFLLISGAIVLLALLFLFFKLPEIIDKNARPAGSIWKFSHFKWGVLGIFVYVGAEVAISSNAVDYFLSNGIDKLITESNIASSIASSLSRVFGDKPISEMTPKSIVGIFIVFYWGGAMVGRFIGSLLTAFFNPRYVLAAFGGMATLLLMFSVFSSGLFSMTTLLAVGFCNSIMFPTIFTLSLKDLGNFTARGSGILCAAILGGGVIPVLFGQLLDISGYTIAFVLLGTCYLFILFYAGKLSESKISTNE